MTVRPGGGEALHVWSPCWPPPTDASSIALERERRQATLHPTLKFTDAVHRDRLDEVADLPVAPNRRP